MTKPIFAVGEFWYSYGTLYRIDAVTPCGSMVEQCTVWDQGPNHGLSINYNQAIPRLGWGSGSFTHRDDFMTAIYKRRHGTE